MTDFSRLPRSIAEARKPRSLRRPLAIVLLLAALGAGVWLGRVPLLRGSADLWIISDPISRGDVVVVLGGGNETRPFIAADLYRKGLASKILVSQVAVERAVTIGASSGHTEVIRQTLLKLDVPATAIETFGIANKNTRDEALALKEWAERNGVSVLIIPSEIFSARRVRWVLRREFSGTSVRIEVPSFEPVKYTRAEWWKTEQGIIDFQNEVLKYIYYRLKY